jgi:hypothetical protein
MASQDGPAGRRTRKADAFDPRAFRLEVQTSVAAQQAAFIDPLDGLADRVRRETTWASVALLTAAPAAGVMPWLASPLSRGCAFAALSAALVLAGGAALGAGRVWFGQRCALREAEQMRDAVMAWVLPKDAEVANWRMRSWGRRDFRQGFRGLVMTDRVRFLLNRKLMVRRITAQRQWGWARGIFLTALASTAPAGFADLCALALDQGRDLAPAYAAGGLGLAVLAAWLAYLWSRALTRRVTAALEPEPDEAFDALDPLGGIEDFVVDVLTRLREHEAFTRRPEADDEDDAAPGEAA